MSGGTAGKDDKIDSWKDFLNPLRISKRADDDEDVGEVIDADSIGGGGHSSHKSTIAKRDLRVSPAIRAFLGFGDGGNDVPADLQYLLAKPHINVPPEVTDRFRPLAEYFVSSSHNTYLIAGQLYGKADTNAYEIALSTGARCVEIDAWDDEADKEEPKVTHGYTLATHISFRAVCETLARIVDKETKQAEGNWKAAPIMISLENHCSEHGQQRLVAIAKEVLGDRLVSKAVHDVSAGSQVTLGELSSKVVLIVEYFFDGQDPAEASSEDEEEDPESREREKKKYERQKKKAPKVKIIPELEELGVYAQSVKPRDPSWYESELKDGPHDHLINVSESALASLLVKSSAGIAEHNSKHLMRVYPKGTRITSANLHPLPFWGVGAQICALNWQTFGASPQLNEALFAGSDGYVLKPAHLRPGASKNTAGGKKKKKLRLHIGGATDVSVPESRDDKVTPYVSCTLYHPDDHKDDPPKRKTSAYKHHNLGLKHHGYASPATDPIWDETLEW